MGTPLIELICDGSRALGSGHLRRSSALAWTLKRRRFRVRFSPISPLENGAFSPPPCDVGAADLFVLDLPYNGDDWVVRGRNVGKPVVTMDFIGAASPDLNVTVFDHGQVSSALVQKVGFQYAMIREDVSRLAPAAPGDGVLVILGGGDLNGMGPVVATQLAGLGEQVTLVEGPFAPMRHPGPDDPFVTLRTPDDLPERMAACRWAVTNGGTTMMEMMCLGKPTHVIPQTDAEERLARHAHHLGGLLGVGLESLWNGQTERAIPPNLSMIARELVDGGGLERIADEVEQLLA